MPDRISGWSNAATDGAFQPPGEFVGFIQALENKLVAIWQLPCHKTGEFERSLMARMKNHGLLTLSAGVLLVLGMLVPARAQDPDDLKRAVARISIMDGEVSVRRGDTGDWVAGVINAPLLADDRIATGPNSRAEVQFDSANILRLGGNAEIHLAQLENGHYQIEVARGTVTYRVLRASSANVEVNTPSISVRPANQGTYRITVAAAGDTELTARAGDVEVFTPRGSEWVRAGQTMQARGAAADPEFQINAAIPADDWDRWNDSRDAALTRSTSYQHVGPGVYGTEDLDQYGVWSEVPPYGPVWRPTVGVGAGWAPYRAGRWVWLDWYGWTWVSADPWGWAPYHYGRWFYEPAFGWCWYPGGIGMRHYWSPALVGFFGYGGVGIGFGFGNIGWVPLAPYEVLHPWWGRGFYGRPGVAIGNVNIASTFRNARVAGGISGMGAADFRSGHFSGIGRVSADQVRSAGLVRGQMPVAPSNANLRFSDRQGGAVPRASGNTRFFSHQGTAAGAARIPFAQQQRAMEQGAGRAPAAANLRGSGASAAPAGGASAATRGSVQNDRPSRVAESSSGSVASQRSGSSGGWQRFGEPGGSQYAPRAAQPSTQSGGGWNRFGSTGSMRPSTPQSQPQYRGNTGGSSTAPSRQSAPQYRAPSSGGGHVSGGGHSGGGHGGHR